MNEYLEKEIKKTLLFKEKTTYIFLLFVKYKI